MHSSLLLATLLFLISFISSTQSKRVLDQMYVSFARARYCVRRLNGTHEIGCQSTSSGNSGRMYMIDNDQEFQSYLINSKLIDSFPSFIVALNLDLFHTDYVDQLITRLDSKLNGLLLYLKSNLTRPTDFSHDDQCPNNRYTYHLNQAQPINWNSKGTGLFFRSFPFPIMLIDELNDYEQLLGFYRKFDSSASTPACGLELKTFQNAAHTTKTCMRRNGISHTMIDVQETYCDPVNGLNIYSKLPRSLTILPNKRQERSVVLILAPTDGFQMFLKTQTGTGGVQQPATGLIIFLALAHLIGEEQEEFLKQNKEIVFVTLDGDALDYSASFRFLFDMSNGYFPNGDHNEGRIQFEHIHSVIEFQSLSFTDKLSLYASPSSLINQTFIEQLVINNRMIINMSSNSSLPPASSQIFLRQTSSSEFPTYLLTSTNETQLANHYYHSFFDDPSTLSINISFLEPNTTTNFSLWITKIVEPLAQTLIESYVGIQKTVTIKQEIVNNLVYCIFKNINYTLIYNIANQSIAKGFGSFDQAALPFSINTYPTSSTPTFPFVKNVLSYFLRDRTYDALNSTETTCRETAKNDTFCDYRYVQGYAPSISPGQVSTGYCVRSYIRSTESSSPAFAINNYDFSKSDYPQWTESQWSAISLRIFVIPTRSHEVGTLVIGILLLSISFIISFILRYFIKMSLLQPSAS